MRTGPLQVVQGPACPAGGECVQEPVYPSNRVARSLDLFLYRGSREGLWRVRTGFIGDTGYELLRTFIPRTWVNRGKGLYRK
jgi:hypothetical protein